MQHKPPSSALATSSFLPIAAAAFAIAIFIVDTVTTLDIAVAVLYVVVVLMAANFLQRRGVLLVGLGCMALTVVSYLLSHGLTGDTALVRCLMSLSAIGALRAGKHISTRSHRARIPAEAGYCLLDCCRILFGIASLHGNLRRGSRYPAP